MCEKTDKVLIGGMPAGSSHCEWLILAVIACMYCVSAYLSYSEGCRRAPWYWPVSILVGLVISATWYAMVKYLDDKQRIYVYSMCWDTTMCCAFYITPLVFFGVKLDRWSVVGLAFMLTGLAIIKSRG